MKWCPVCSWQTDILKSIGTSPNPPLLFKWTSYMESFQNVTKRNAALTELNILSNLTQIWSDYICCWSVYFCWLLVQPQDHLCLQLTSQKKRPYERVQAVTDLSFLNCLWWEEDLREGIHGSLDWVALDSRHRVQDLLRQFGLVSQGIQDQALLLGTKRTHNTQVSGNNQVNYSTFPTRGTQALLEKRKAIGFSDWWLS